jgi:hypothetical protein
LGSDVSAVFMLLPNGDALWLVAGVGWGDYEIDRVSLPVPSDTLAYRALIAGDELSIVQEQLDPDHLSPQGRALGLVSMVNVRIGDRSAPMGIIGVAERHRRKYIKDMVGTHFDITDQRRAAAMLE